MRGPGLDGSALLLLLAVPAAVADPGCGWREPPRTYPDGVRWSCTAVAWTDGDTLAVRCDGRAGLVMVRPRGVDADERGEGRWRRVREELRRRTEGRALDVAPHHDSHRRVVADVLAGGVDVGAAMHAAGWSKSGCPKRKPACRWARARRRRRQPAPPGAPPNRARSSARWW